MEQTVLNYRVIIEPDERTGTNEPCYFAYCPTLDVFSDGDTFEEALHNVQEAIQLRVEVLVEAGETVPVDNIDQQTVVTTSIPAPKGIKFAAGV